MRHESRQNYLIESLPDLSDLFAVGSLNFSELAGVGLLDGRFFPPQVRDFDVPIANSIDVHGEARMKILLLVRVGTSLINLAWPTPDSLIFFNHM